MSDRTWRWASAIAFGPSVVLVLVFMTAKGTGAVVSAVLAVSLALIGGAALYFWERVRAASRSAPETEAEPGSNALDIDDGRRDARAEERAIPLDLGVRWDVESPEAWLVQRNGSSALILRAHPEDEDQRLVVLVWPSCTLALMTPPCPKSKHEHRLSDRGLLECEWSAEVHESAWAAQAMIDQAQRHVESNGAPPPKLRHFIVLTKERTVEVIGLDVSIRRVAAIGFSEVAPNL